MTLRPALLHDTKALLALEQQLFTCNDYPLSRAMFYYHIRHNLLMVAYEHDILAGYGLMLIRRRTPKLYSLAVAPQFQHQGLAMALLHALHQPLNAQKSVLEVRTTNTGAIALYEKYGYRIHNTLHGFYKDGKDAYMMQRTSDA
jgi:[ribosomal protein S18]-alanine N-acetyltransferase